MRAFLLACVAIIVLGAGGYFLLDSMQQPTGFAYTTDGTRIAMNWSWREPSNGACDTRKSWQWIFVDLGTPDGESAACSISQ